MDRVVRRSGLPRALVLGVALSAAALATAATATGSGVTFTNDSHHPVDLYTRYGGSSCVSASTAKKVTVDAGKTASIDSGDAKVCYCLAIPDRATCPGGWLEAAAGSTHLLE